jgi:tRNA (cytidine/uridine-2'-O-)-methyltransferase
MARKLRVPPLTNPFRIVLVEPEIPQNTGNIARLCAATQSHLHLCGRLGFRIDERAVRRAGVDYWHLVSLHVHPDFGTFVLQHPDARVRLFSANGEASYLDADLAPGDALVFGKESSGLSRDVIDRHPDAIFGIPTAGAVRSLNLASAAAIVLYEALRRCGGLDGARPEGDEGGTDFVR